MKKASFILLMAFLGLGVNYAFAGGDDIILLPLDSIIIEDNHGRSPELEPCAVINDGILTLDYYSVTASEVIIVNRLSEAVVYSSQYAPSTQVQVNISVLPIGLYRLEVYAFGKWWWGEFVIEEE